MNLTVAERETIQRIERFGASISLVGVCLIFLAYGLFTRVRTVPNTFILFASIANVGASIACLIGYAGIMAGDSSALCQAQGFLLEMFMQSDPWWSFAMAVNVYMVFFMTYHPHNFHRHLWLYCLVCFGVPAIPACICLFYAPNGRRIYGNATLWCWIDDSYNELRIFTYYLPIWACIVLSAFIYMAVGYHVFHQRNQLRNLTLSNQAKDANTDNREYAAEKGLPAIYGTVTTDIRIVAESSGSQTPPSTSVASIEPVLNRAPLPTLHSWGSPDDDVETIPPAGGPQAKPFTTISTISSKPREAKEQGNALIRAWRRFMSKLHHLDPIKLAYLRTSFVFAISILVTWAPSSINRVYSLVHPDRTSYALNLASAIVLPLQGVWNAVIFAATSWNTLTEETYDLLSGRRWWSGSGPRRRLSSDGHRGSRAAADFRGRHGSAPESRELVENPRMSNVRVYRGGSL
ncbi:hypothetical protein VTK26DRAFT_2103 [Humicola hyalothermophila]